MSQDSQPNTFCLHHSYTLKNPKMKNPPHLPEELLIEIFSRLPGKSVGRFSCLSKSWRTNLSTSQFVKLHHSRGSISHLIKSRTGFHTFNLDGDVTVVQKKLEFDAGIGGYCNGLVLLWRGDECIVVNPLTMEQVTIKHKPLSGDPDIALITYGFGYDSCSDDNKIVKLTVVYTKSNRDPFELRTFVDVYSLKKGAWKRTDDNPYLIFRPGIFVNGYIYWIAIPDVALCVRSLVENNYVIVAFEVAHESFSHIPAPNKTYLSRIFEHGGGLLLLCNQDIWMMKECGQENSWTKFPKTIPFEPRSRVTPLFLVGGNEVVLDREGSLIMWNMIDGTTKDLIFDGAVDKVIEGITYVESLVSPIQYQN